MSLTVDNSVRKGCHEDKNDEKYSCVHSALGKGKFYIFCGWFFDHFLQKSHKVPRSTKYPHSVEEIQNS